MVTKDLCIEVFNSMIRGTPVSLQKSYFQFIQNI